jgi:hypothetical protein
MWYRKWMIRVSALVILTVLWFVPKNRFVVVNESGQPIHDLTITVSERTYHFGTVEPGESRSAFYYTPESESYFDVRGELKDGKAIDDSVDYIVWEDYFKHVVLRIRPDGQVVYE